MDAYWTKERLKLLRQLWIETRDWREVRKSFPEKPTSNIRRAYYTNYKGQRVGRVIYWTPERDQLLTELWTTVADIYSIREHFPGQLLYMIRKRACWLKLKRPAKEMEGE